jgi:hypothetical protein
MYYPVRIITLIPIGATKVGTEIKMLQTETVEFGD